MESANNLQEELETLNSRVARQLWSLLDTKSENTASLIIPLKGKVARISEQEARFVFCQVLADSRWYYSPETPTSLKYSFKSGGTKHLSARTDVTLYETRDPSSKLVNIEFKAHNPPTESFRKDLEKLVREGLAGLWFHILKNFDSATFPSIFAKLRDSFHKLELYLKDGQDERLLLFCFCVLEKRRLFQGGLALIRK